MNERVMLITGASSGFGAATARLAVRKGFRVALGARRLTALRALVSELGGAATAVAAHCDVREWDDQRGLVATALEAFGRVDVAFANAGVGGPLRGFTADTPDHWRELVLTNVYGTALTVRAVLPELRRLRGHLVITGSVAGRVVVPGSLYSCTKWSVSAMAAAVRAELHGSGVRVTLVQPGISETPMRADEIDAPLLAEDVAEAVLYAACQPPRVDVSEIVLRPAGQAI